AVPQDLSKSSDEDLLRFQVQLENPGAKDNWLARHSRRILQERAATGRLEPGFEKKLSKISASSLTENQTLRLLWATHVTVGLNEARALQLLKSKYEFIRAWSIQLSSEPKHVSEKLFSQFTNLAKSDPSPIVRLYLASAAQRLPGDKLEW